MSRGIKKSKLNYKRKKNFIRIMGTSIVLVTVSLGAMYKICNKNIREIEYDTLLASNTNDINENILQLNDKKNTGEEEIAKKEAEDKAAAELKIKEEQNYSYSDNAKEIEERISTWNFQREDGKKVAYLTFDDGPSDYVTNEILDVLAANDVKATFFVLGTSIEKDDKSKAALRRIAAEGHAIGNHGYCHNYGKLYPNGTADVDFFMKDIKKTKNIINNTLGYNLDCNIIRMPGGHGSWNTGELDDKLGEEGYSYIDWNALNGDAEAYSKGEDELINGLQNTVTDLYGNDDVLVVLMHDTDMKETTVLALDQNIKYLKSLGYEFRTLR